MYNYLSALFEKDLHYKTINSHRSTIAAYHSYVDKKPVGKHPRVCFADRGLQSEATTASLFNCLGCWNNFGLIKNEYAW